VSIFKPYQQQIIKELEAILPPEPLFDIIRYHLGLDNKEKAKGKMLRPLLCLFACKAVGGDFHIALPVACTIELIHNFSLIHDDIEDGSPTRRHQPAVWKVWGQAQAINAGDALLSLAYLSLSRLQVSPKMILRIDQIISETCLQLCQGQYLDIAFEKERSISQRDYFRMASAKTAALFKTSLHLGALVGGGKRGEIQHLCRYGQNLGLGFQIQDDFLSLWGEEGDKFPPDILRKKKIFPIVYAIEKGEGRMKEELLHIYTKENLEEEDVVKVLSLLEGVKGHCLSIIEEHYSRALMELELTGLPASSQEELRQVVASLQRRGY